MQTPPYCYGVWTIAAVFPQGRHTGAPVLYRENCIWHCSSIRDPNNLYASKAAALLSHDGLVILTSARSFSAGAPNTS